MDKQAEIKERILQRIDNRKDDIIRFLQSLIRVPSVTGNEKAYQEFLAKTLGDMGFKVDSWEIDEEELKKKYPDYFISRMFAPPLKDRPNVVGTLKGTGDGKSLLFNGHADVVSPEPVANWKRDPWGGAIEDGKVYGRGTCDMKGGIAAHIMAVKILLDEGIKLHGDIIIESPIEEEGPGTGTVACQARGYKADAGIVTEPTNNEFMTAFTGGVYPMIFVDGLASHATMSWEGVDAVEKAMLIVEAIKSYGTWRTSTCKHPLYQRYPQTAGSSPITMFDRADSKQIGTVPSLVLLGTRGTVMPGEKPEDIIKLMEAWIKKATDNDKWLKEHPPKFNWYNHGPRSVPAEIPVEHPLVQTMMAGYKQTTGKQPVVAGFISPADWQSLNTIDPVTPSLGFGPGGIRQAHTADEFVPIEQVIECTKVLAITILDWCGFD
jgi:acetylornithine deacetylase